MSRKRKKIMTCQLCRRDDVPEAEMNASGYCCKLCERDYVAFRRAFRAEHGRWPKLSEFMEDEPI